MAEKDASGPCKQRKLYFCGHCQESVSKTLYFQHRAIYYDKRAKQWAKDRVVPLDLGDDFDFAKAEAAEQKEMNIQSMCLNYYYAMCLICSLPISSYIIVGSPGQSEEQMEFMESTDEEVSDDKISDEEVSDMNHDNNETV